MRLINVIFAILLVVGIVLSCIEPFTPGTTEYKEMLVIEGLITDNPLVPAKVTISRTFSLSRNYGVGDLMESGAIVTVICDDGNIYSFEETSPGIYRNTTTIEPETGKVYQLVVHTLDGNIFESDFESYKPSPPIDSITYAFDIVQTSELDPGVSGLQFYAHSKSLDSDPLYLRWILDATYQYAVPFYSNFFWTGSSLVEFLNDTLIQCWKSENVPGVFVGDSYGMMENRVAYAPLNFVSQYGYQLMIRYSLHAYQLSISESSYAFWFDLNKLVNETGGLYEVQPFRLEGNIRCASDPDVNVTGVFEVAGVSELRVFATKPPGLIVYTPTYCKYDTIGGIDLPWSQVKPGSYIYGDVDQGLYVTAPDYCFNCTVLGGTNKRPPYWE